MPKIQNQRPKTFHKQKTRTMLSWMLWFGFQQIAVGASLSTYKHLILGVGLIDGLRHGRNEDFEPATEARHNRG